jgi:ferritin-like metal-binding protein YciE
MSTLKETFIDELKDLYDAEKQLIKGLPKMAKAAESEELRAAFEKHLEETEIHVERLEQVFELLDEEAKGKKCKGMAGLLEEGSELIQEKAGDAALICAAQKVEHYEIASYGSLVAWGEIMGEDEAVELLQQTLEEEKITDETLTTLAESVANPEAESEEEEETGKGQKSKRATASK